MLLEIHPISFLPSKQNRESAGAIRRSSRGGMALVRLLSLTQKHMACHRATEVRLLRGWGPFLFVCVRVCVLKRNFTWTTHFCPCTNKLVFAYCLLRATTNLHYDIFLDESSWTFSRSSISWNRITFKLKTIWFLQKKKEFKNDILFGISPNRETLKWNPNKFNSLKWVNSSLRHHVSAPQAACFIAPFTDSHVKP